jgi:hypothetical protein
MTHGKILSKVQKNAKISHYNEQIIHSNNKIKTTWNIIRRETGRNNIKCDKVNILNTDKENNNSVNAESFNKYFLTIPCKIMGGNKQIIGCAKHYLIYLKYLIFHLPTLFSIIHLQGKLKKLLTPSLVNTRVGMMKFQ